MKYVLIILWIWISPVFHAGHVAEYYYQLDGQELNLKFVIEKEELMRFEFKDDCDYQSMTALCTAKYLKKQSFIKINNEKIEMELQNAYTEGEHLIVLLTSKWEGGAIRKINIENRCFYEFDALFKNRIIMDVAQFQKSYLLNKKRSKIKLK